MKLTIKQEEGLKTIVNRCLSNERYTTIAGYAGTGKSTLVKVAIEALGVDLKDVAYATFTGKAAEVLRKKGNQGAITLHKLLYDHFPKPEGGYVRKPKQKIDYKVIVVDEVSMVPKSMIDLLLSHRAYVIFLGDPFQLPQIDKDQEHDILDHPHVFLDEVMRQAAESEIVRLTMKIRNGESISCTTGNEVMVMNANQMVDGCLTWADQIIVATNAKRNIINQKMRQILGFSGNIPQDGEKLICLHNYWEDFSTLGDSLVNGTTGIIRNPVANTIQVPRYVRIPDNKKIIPVVTGTFITDENNEYVDIHMDKQLIDGNDVFLNWRESYILHGMKDKLGVDLVPREFDYGYAITAHKSQGSQWEKVLVIEEAFPFNKIDHARWLYTACTRPEKKLVLVKRE